MVVGLASNALAQTDSTAAKKPQKYTGPVPCAVVNSHNGSLLPVGKFVFINRYFNVTKDQVFDGTDKIDPPANFPLREFAYQELQTAFRAGIVKGVDVRLIFSTFQKRLDREIPSYNADGVKSKTTITDINSGIGDAKIIGRYGILNQKTGPFNLIAGIGTTLPLGSTDATDNRGNLLPAAMQLGAGAWNPLFEIGMHKIIKRNWISAYFVYMKAFDGDFGEGTFKRSSTLKYNFAYAYALSNMFDIGAEINCELKDKVELNDVEVDATGGHVVFFAPEVHFKFAKNMHLDLSYAIPVYQDLNGPQLGYTSVVAVKLAMKF